MSEARSSEKLVRPKLFELAAAELRQRIVSGKLPAGTALPAEQELIAQFGISRPTLRQALRVLESESLITINRGVNGGAQVGRPDARLIARYASYLLAFTGAPLEDVYLVRLAIVPAAARMVAESGCVEHIGALGGLLTEAESVRHDADEYLRRMTRFTSEIIARSGNNAFALMGAITDEVYSGTVAVLSSRIELSVNREMLARVERDARQLFELIRDGRGPEAERLWHSYMEAIHAFVHEHLGDHKVVEALEFLPVGPLPQRRAGRAKLATVVAEGLRQRILNDDLREGDPLPSTNELLREFDVSAPTLSEGLRILESESLITIHRGSRGGPRVSRPSVSVLARYASYALAFGGTTADDFVVGAGAVVTVAAQRLASCPTPDDVAALRRRAADARLALGGRGTFGEYMLALVKEVVDRAGSPVLSLLHDMSTPTWRLVLLSLDDFPAAGARARVGERMLGRWIEWIETIAISEVSATEASSHALIEDMTTTLMEHVRDISLLELMRRRQPSARVVE